MSGLASPAEYVGIGSELSAGDEITAEDLIAVPVPGDAEQLTKSLIPFANKALLFGTNATRNYSDGDVVFQRDLQSPVERSNWQVIGPFQLIGVGERFKQSSREGNEYAGTEGNNVTIAVDKNFNEQTCRLLEAINADRLSDGDDSRHHGILEVQVMAGQTATNELPSEVVYQTVSLDGVANVPTVLLEGNMIRFVVPALPAY